MTKSAFAIAIAIFTFATMLGSAAEAGFKVRLGFGGPVPFHGHQYSNDYQPKTYRKRTHRKVERRAAPKKVETAKAQPAKDIETAPVAQAETENSSITTASAEATQTASVETASVVAPEELGCKKFFASVGMVLSVPCE